MTYLNQILHGDALSRLRELPDESVNTVVTSPPYWGLRDYGVEGQIGLEPTHRAFVDRLIAVFEEVHRVLREDGTLWLNLGDSYCTNPPGNARPDHSGSAILTTRGKQGSTKASHISQKKNFGTLKPKDLVGIPWRVALALQDAGWWLRSDIIWSKPNPMPESVTDRPTKSHEYIFLLSKSSKYFYDHAAVREMSAGGNNWPVKGGPVPNNVPQSRNRKTTRNIRPGVDTKGGNQGNGSITFPEGTRNLRSV